MEATSLSIEERKLYVEKLSLQRREEHKTNSIKYCGK